MRRNKLSFLLLEASIIMMRCRQKYQLYMYYTVTGPAPDITGPPLDVTGPPPDVIGPPPDVTGPPPDSKPVSEFPETTSNGGQSLVQHMQYQEQVVSDSMYLSHGVHAHSGIRQLVLSVCQPVSRQKY